MLSFDLPAAEVGSASHKNYVANARTTALKFLRCKRFCNPPIIAPQVQPQAHTQV